MAGLGTKLWTSGEVVTAAGVNGYLQDQTIGKFATTTARDAAFGGAGEPTLSEGMFAYTSDTNTLWLYNGSSWVAVLGSDIGEISTDNRNVVINGAMQIAQRGTSTASITTANYYTADRWQFNVNLFGTWTQSQEADAPTGSGFRNSLKVLCTTADASPAAADTLNLNQRFEGQNVQQFLKGTSSAKPFAVSFWVKSNVTGTYIAELLDNNNTRQVSASYTINASATWEKKTITFPADTTGAFTNDNANSLQLNFWLGAGSDRTSGTLNTTWASTVQANRAVGQTNLAAATSNYWQITGVQLEAGAVATPFEFEQISTTLAKCQRYYYRVQGGYLGVGFAISTSTNIINVPIPVSMRTTPSAIETTGVAANYAQVLSSTGTQVCNAVPAYGGAAGVNNFAVSSSSASTGLTAGNATMILSLTGTSFLAVSAEL